METRNIKVRLMLVGKTQVDLVNYFQNHGYPSMCPQTMSAIVNMRLNTPQAYNVRREINLLLDGWEAEQNEE